MVRYVVFLLSSLFLYGCSSVTVDKGYLVKEDTYKVPVMNNPSWLRAAPLNSSLVDAAYFRCPNEQKIVVFETILCGEYDYSRLTPQDYVDRIYKGKGWTGYCTRRPDENFQKLDGVPVVDIDKRQVSIVFDASYDIQVCGTNAGMTQMKVKDVFFEDRRHHFGQHDSRFVAFRYMSPVDQFDNGVGDFDQMVSKFEWINPELPTEYEFLKPERKLDLHGKSFNLEFTDGRGSKATIGCSKETLDRRTDLEGSVGRQYFQKAVTTMIEESNGRIDPNSPNRLAVDLNGLSFTVFGHWFYTVHGLVEFKVNSPFLNKSYCSDMTDRDEDSPLRWYSYTKQETATKLILSGAMRRAAEQFVSDLAGSSIP